jgi:porphobilinogen synthase
MPEVYRWSVDAIVAQVEHWKAIGLNAFALFPCVMTEKKCSTGKEAINPNSISFQAAKKIKARHKDTLLIADIALDPFTDHGHDGILDSSGKVDNDLTVEILCKSAVIAAQSGFDVVAPSDMMDGRVGEIRKSLDEAGFEHVAILAYSAKFCSAYYGPFRDAISSSQEVPIDKSGYQLDPANHREALLELKLDEQEGADILMVKPAEPYLDIIKSAKENSSLPVAAYQVSGEYSRIWAASKLGWLDLDKCAEESLISIKRAGADMILTYFAERIVARI